MSSTPTGPTASGVAGALVTIVTGASSGIGLATATALSAEGHTVIGTSRNATTAPEVPGVRMVDLDITSPASIQALVAQVIAEHGRIDVLVNNAGMGAAGAAEESTLEQDQRLFDLNVFGLMRMTKAVLPHMRQRGSGRVVNISSVLGFLPSPFMAAYAATKHAVEGWSESLDHEVRQFGVRVVLVEPAYTNTSFEASTVRPDRPLHAYAHQRAVADSVNLANAEAGDAPSVVAAVVLAAATDPKPRLRYTAGPMAKRVSVLRRLVPAKAFDAQMRKMNKLPA